MGFRAQGHNIFLEDGIETNNIIEYNLLMNSRAASFMLQTDITVASIWITNPLNTVRHNHCAGSDFYGMWYEVRAHPEGPSATDEICQQGNPLQEYTGNVAHSNVRFGLRLFTIQSRQVPCQPIRNITAADPWVDNPSIQQVYTNFVTYKNMESGVLAEYMGNAVFRNFVILDSFRAGFQIHQSNFTKEEVVLTESIIVGRSQGNAATLAFHLNSKAVIMPRTDGFAVTNVAFHNFGTNMILVEGSSENDNVKLWVQGGKQVGRFSGIKKVACDDAKIVKWLGPRTNYVLDEDGSLTGKLAKTYFTPYYPYFDDVTQCKREAGANYDNSVVCTGVDLRGYLFRNPIPLDNFKSIPVKVFNLNGANTNVTAAAEANFGSLLPVLIKNPEKDAIFSNALVLPTDYVFNIHFKEGVDWSHLLVQTSYYSTPTDKTTVLRFNYTEQRELFEIKKMLAGKVVSAFPQASSLDKLVNPSTGKPNNDDATGCVHGDWYLDDSNKQVYVCVNGKQRSNPPLDWIDMNGIYCRETCAQAGFNCKKETFVRDWDNTTQWTTNKYVKRIGTATWTTGVPTENDDVLIPCEWSMSLNTNSLKVGSLTIDGSLRLDERIKTFNIEAGYIWVRGGKLAIGYADNRYDGKLTITLTGGFTSQSVAID